MYVEQIYTSCLAQGAYYITSNGEAAIIDPLRDIKPYLQKLERDKVTLKYIFETHFHADFISGHIDLSKQTNAPIIFGPNAQCGFECLSAIDKQIFKIGDITIQVIHTPGHTMESTCYLLFDEQQKEYALFSGDTLFIGDVGRPDLAQQANHLTSEKLASILYHSLRNKIMPLPDHVIVYPAHGAGSACGKNMSKETVSTIGEQKALNYALNPNLSEEQFVFEVLKDLAPPPSYFSMNVAMNKKGYKTLDFVKENGLKPVSLFDFENLIKDKDILILDTRNPADFAKQFIKQSINIGLNGDFAPWVGALVQDVEQKIVLVTEVGKEEETITRLARVGFDNIVGYLDGGFETWLNGGKEFDKIHEIDATDFWDKNVDYSFIKNPHAQIIDIRKESEFKLGKIENAQSKPLAEINNWIHDINPNEHFFMYCGSGYRSTIAASILKARGYTNFTEINGGYQQLYNEYVKLNGTKVI
ncbi:MAG: MBL fold metallo-hydrolase [Sediminibacterium sp.]|nr:MBL fold metallo-hydrolase [Sediminibacterium sp.]